MSALCKPTAHQYQRARLALQRERGFTLIEILVVVVIVSILAGLTTLSIGGGELRTLRSEAKRLQQVMTLARSEAGYHYQELGLLTEEDSYRLLRFDNQSNRWVDSDETAFGLHRLPALLSLSLNLPEETPDLAELSADKNKGFVHSDSVDEEDEVAKLKPQILLLSSDEVTPFTLTLSLNQEQESEGAYAHISSDGLSSIELEYSNEP